MALGDQNQDNGNNGGAKTVYSPVTYSPMAFKNPTSKIASEISFSYWKGTLAISISAMLPRRQGATFDEYDRDNAVVIYLNSSKARISRKKLNYILPTGPHLIPWLFAMVMQQQKSA